jgi:hypothetical protein
VPKVKHTRGISAESKATKTRTEMQFEYIPTMKASPAQPIQSIERRWTHGEALRRALYKQE